MKITRAQIRNIILKEMAGSMTMDQQVSLIYSDLATSPDGLLEKMLNIVMENANIGVLEYGGGFEYRALRNGVEDFINTGIFDLAKEAKELDAIIRNILVRRIFPEIEGNPRSVRLEELSMTIQDVLEKLALLKHQNPVPFTKQPMQYYRGDTDDSLYEMATARDSLLSAQLPVDPKVKEAADYLEDGIRSSIEFADHPIEADPEYQINRTLEAVRYELNFTDFMFPGVDLDEVKVELMRRLA